MDEDAVLGSLAVPKMDEDAVLGSLAVPKMDEDAILVFKAEPNGVAAHRFRELAFSYCPLAPSDPAFLNCIRNGN